MNRSALAYQEVGVALDKNLDLFIVKIGHSDEAGSSVARVRSRVNRDVLAPDLVE